ncbi:lyase family protein [Roseibium marinum]|uniref:3-carboxy-cis,cis-muconate cycloisomerase n=1 Tax=Roseibium marinum TaxID=281252 RepID=A0A2S3V132_9HYPH|nr:lyase family protein [Roseibium marinum]POF33682.1 3-carboxy-cis,cis-muconate cycloisomerase [Roseibium marinum]
MPVSLFSSTIYSGLFADEEILEILGERSDVAHMVRFERALAKVQGKLGIIPRDAALAIEDRLKDADVDPASLKSGTRSAGVPVPALVAVLRKVAGEEAGQWLHWGATSQDVMDTAAVLQSRACLGSLQSRLARLIDTLETQSHRTADRLMAGRTRSQIATPITLGYRIAQWAHPLIDAENALPGLKSSVLRVQFGGASGINSAIAPDGSAVSAALAAELGLEDSPSWHVNRTPVLLLAGWLQQVCAGLAKMAGDLVLLGRSEIAEVTSGTGGGSSTMPQKANPVQAETILALNRIAIAAQAGLSAAADPAEERDGARWPLEWMFLPQMLLATGTALRHAQDLAESLKPNDDTLDASLETNPEIMAEAASFLLAGNGVPRARAKELVAAAASGSAPFAEALAKSSPAGIDWREALDPREAIAPAREMSERIFARRQKSNGS